MEGISVIIPCYNKLDLTKDFVNFMEQTKDAMIEFIMIDNNSTDGTANYLKGLAGQFRYHINPENIGMVQAFNQGASLGKFEILVFMHNDVFIHIPDWPMLLRKFFIKKSDIGIVGFYGAKHIRKDGSFMGRSIVHSKIEGGNLKRDDTDVAVVDGLFMAMHRDVYNKVGGFNTNYIMHYYDKDISLKAYINGYKNYIVNIPFTHKGAGTRSLVKAEKDLALRNNMKEIFLEQWKAHLPVDVRTSGERIMNWIKKYV